jgi:hypothetical protein
MEVLTRYKKAAVTSSNNIRRMKHAMQPIKLHK